VRDFTWQVFTQTGDIEAYLLYKEIHGLGELGVEHESIVDEDNPLDEE